MSLEGRSGNVHTPALRLNVAAFYSHRGFIDIDLNLIMIVLVPFYLGIFRGLVTQKTENLAEEVSSELIFILF